MSPPRARPQIMKMWPFGAGWHDLWLVNIRCRHAPRAAVSPWAMAPVRSSPTMAPKTTAPVFRRRHRRRTSLMHQAPCMWRLAFSISGFVVLSHRELRDTDYAGTDNTHRSILSFVCTSGAPGRQKKSGGRRRSAQGLSAARCPSSQGGEDWNLAVIHVPARPGRMGTTNTAANASSSALHGASSGSSNASAAARAQCTATDPISSMPLTPLRRTQQRLRTVAHRRRRTDRLRA